MPRNRSASSSSRSRSRQNRRRPTKNNYSSYEANQEPKIYVGGLDVDVQADDLKDLLKSEGQINDCFVIRKDTFAFAFVTFSNMKDAESAVQKYNDEEMGGKRMKINLAKPRPPRDSRDNFRDNRNNRDNRDNSRRPSGCFKCGGEGHMARQCTNAPMENNRQERPRGSGCFKCGESGHFARECPNPSADNGNGRNRNPPRRQNRRSSSSQKGGRRRKHRRSASSSSSR